MGCRDRTHEFFEAVNRIQSSPSFSSPSSSSSSSHTGQPPSSISGLGAPLLEGKHHQIRAAPPGDPLLHKTKFTRFAQDIASRIHATAGKMEKLTLLARRRSNFDDPAEQIDLLTGQIKSDLNHLNQEIESLAKFGQVHPGSRGKSTQAQSHNQKIVETLQFDLGTATKGFTDILQIRTQSLKQKNERRETFGGSVARRRRRVAPMVSMQDQNLLLDNDTGAMNPGRSDDTVIEIDTSDMQQQAQVEGKDAYLQSRGQAVESIEKTIAELSTMYKKLVQIVSMQGEMTERIDQNITDAQINVERSENELWKLHQSFSSSQWLILKVFLFLIVFAVFFIVFVA